MEGEGFPDTFGDRFLQEYRKQNTPYRPTCLSFTKILYAVLIVIIKMEAAGIFIVGYLLALATLNWMWMLP